MRFSDPPGPAPRLVDWALIRRLRFDALGLALDLRRKYGDQVHFRIGPAHIYQFTHPDDLREILDTKAAAFKKPFWMTRAFRRWNGNSLAFVDGPAWARQRPLLEAALPDAVACRYVDAAARHTRQRVLDRLGQEVEIVGLVEPITFHVMAEAVLGGDAAAESEQLYAEFSAIHAIAIAELRGSFPIPDWVPTPRKRRLKNAIRAARSTIERCLKQRRHAGQGDDLLSRLLAAAPLHNISAPADVQVRDEAISLLFAGKESPAAALVWGMYLLASHGAAQDTAIAEVDSVLRGQPVSLEHLPRLKYLEMVLKEAMRLYPPAYLLSRQAVQSVRIGGYDVRRHGQVIIAIYATQRDARWFPNPNDFRPERFAPGTEGSIPPFAYLAFGAGPRTCIGRTFSLMEGVAVLATILSVCRLSLPENHRPPQYDPAVVLYPKGGLKLRFDRRESGPPGKA